MDSETFLIRQADFLICSTLSLSVQAYAE